MNKSKKTGVLVLSGILVFGGIQLFEQTEVGKQLGISGLTRFVSTADAKVGRPATPVSVAGVARRTSRRN